MPKAEVEVEDDTTLEDVNEEAPEDVENPEDVTDPADDETPTAPTAEDLKKAQDEAAKWRRLAEKASKRPAAIQTPNKPQESVTLDEKDELRLVAKGFSEEDIEQAKAIAKGKGVKLNAAIEDPLFLAYQSVQADKAKKEKAALAASRGSGHGQPAQEGAVTPNMTPEEHRAVWNKTLSR